MSAPFCGLAEEKEGVGISEFGGTGRPGKGDNVTDVFHARHIHDKAFEAQAEAGMVHAAKAPQIEIPPIGLLLETEVPHLVPENVDSFFPL